MKLIYFLLFTLFSNLSIKSQSNDSIILIRHKGSYWSPKRQIYEKLILIFDSTQKIRYFHIKYKTQKTSTRNSIFYDTILKKGSFKIKNNPSNEFISFIDSSIEKDDTLTIKKIIYASTKKDFQKSLKIKNPEINLENNCPPKLNEFDFIELKKEAIVHKYIISLIDKKKSIMIINDANDNLYVDFKFKDIEYYINLNYFDEMGQPFYLYKKSDSTHQRYLNVALTIKLYNLVPKFKIFKNCLNKYNILNTFTHWYLANRFTLKNLK